MYSHFTSHTFEKHFPVVMTEPTGNQEPFWHAYFTYFTLVSTEIIPILQYYRAYFRLSITTKKNRFIKGLSNANSHVTEYISSV